jgi:hypothetical protein
VNVSYVAGHKRADIFLFVSCLFCEYWQYYHVVCVIIDGGWIGEWIYGPLTSILHDSNLHNSPITTAPAKPFPACCVFTSRSLATASNSVDSSASRAQVLSSRSPVQNWLSSNFVPCLYHLGTDHIENTALLLLRSCLLLQERIYRAVAQKRPWYVRLSLGRWIATALHTTIRWYGYVKCCILHKGDCLRLFVIVIRGGWRYMSAMVDHSMKCRD